MRNLPRLGVRSYIFSVKPFRMTTWHNNIKDPKYVQSQLKSRPSHVSMPYMCILLLAKLPCQSRLNQGRIDQMLCNACLGKGLGEHACCFGA